MPKTAVIIGGPSPEHDVSILTGLQAARTLQRAGRDVTVLYWSKAADWYEITADLEGKDFLEGVPRSGVPLVFQAGPGGGFVASKKKLRGASTPLEIDVAVNCCHGGPGENGTLQGALDLAGIAYTGPDVPGAGLGMDKLAFGAVVVHAGLPSLPRVSLSEATQDLPFPTPFIVKPRFGGSSIGVEVVDSLDTAKALLRSSPHLRSGAVIEPFIENSCDLNVGSRSFPKIEVTVVEKPLRSNDKSAVLGYADKYVGGEGMVSAPREIPADLPGAMTESVRNMATRVVELAGVRGVSRIDFLQDGSEVYVNEINTIPGSLAQYLFVEPKVDFATLLDDMIAEARKRPSASYTSQGADGTALRSAGAIAGKLS